VGVELFNVDGQTDEHDEVDNRFLAISRRRLKINQVINFSLQKRSATCLAIQSLASHPRILGSIPGQSI
jgi:hypothetical protein